MHDPIIKPQPVKAVVCPYHWINIPATNGTSRRMNGASFQNKIALSVCIRELFTMNSYASTGIFRAEGYVVQENGGKNKTTRSNLKRKRQMANKLKQAVCEKELGIRGKKKFPQVFVENKGLEEICRRVFTGILDS